MADEILISGFDMELVSPACHPGADRWSAQAHLSTDISEVLPYINGRFEDADYDDRAKVLVLKAGGKKFAFRPTVISAAPAENRDEAYRMLQEITEVVNETWRKRYEIEPSLEKRVLPTVMELYRHLPRSNCGACGYSTCMAFAAGVRSGETDLSCCPPLAEEGWTSSRDSLTRLLGTRQSTHLRERQPPFDDGHEPSNGR